MPQFFMNFLSLFRHEKFFNSRIKILVEENLKAENEDKNYVLWGRSHITSQLLWILPFTLHSTTNLVKLPNVDALLIAKITKFPHQCCDIICERSPDKKNSLMAILVVVEVPVLRLSAVICQDDGLLGIAADPSLDDVLLELQEVIIAGRLVDDQRDAGDDVINDAEIKNFGLGGVLLQLPIQRPVQVDPSHVGLVVDSFRVVAEAEELILVEPGPLANVLQALGAFALGTQRAVDVRAICNKLNFN